MLTLIITRHGETQWNLERRMQGHLDSPLTELGHQQAKWLSERLANRQIDFIYSSPLGRAFTTAKILKGERHIDIICDDRLSEINLGIWQGKLMDEIIDLDHDNYDNFWNQPDQYISKQGESFYDVKDRITNFYNEIKEKHRHGTLLMVAHAGVLRSLMCYLFHDGDIKELWKHNKVEPASLTILKVDDDRVLVEKMVDTSHYKIHRQGNGWFDDIK